MLSLKILWVRSGKSGCLFKFCWVKKGGNYFVKSAVMKHTWSKLTKIPLQNPYKSLKIIHSILHKSSSSQSWASSLCAHKLIIYVLLSSLGRLKYLTLTEANRVWMPDLFFSNEKEGHFHNIIMPNVYIRIFPYGSVLYSIRISLTLACPMNLKLYPLDRQICSLRMASCEYIISCYAVKHY